MQRPVLVELALGFHFRDNQGPLEGVSDSAVPRPHLDLLHGEETRRQAAEKAELGDCDCGHTAGQKRLVQRIRIGHSGRDTHQEREEELHLLRRQKVGEE